MEEDPDNSLVKEVAHIHIASGQDVTPVEQFREQHELQLNSEFDRNFRDISSEFRAAASALNTGQLVKDPYFTLFEAVGALEIMDPKMDSGFLSQNETLDDNYNILKKLSPEEVIGVMDQLTCYEMAWHMGHQLSRCLFASHYIDRLLWPNPKTLDEAQFDRDGLSTTGNNLLHLVLRSYCLALIKTCDYVHRRIGAEHYYEEEDFVPNLYNRKLLTDIESFRFRELLKEAERFTDQEVGIDLKIRQAIQLRLVLRDRLLSAVESDLVGDQTNQIRRWEQCLELLPELHDTWSIGTAVNEACSTKIQRRLASSMPPRPLVEISFEDAFTHLTHLCQNGTEVYRVLDYHGSTTLLTFAYTFQSRKPQPSIYIRCLLQSLIFHDAKVLGFMTITKFVFDDLGEIVLPADVLLDPSNSNVEAPFNPRFQMVKQMRAFVLRVGDPLLDLFRAICMNRARMRRMLCHLILDWENVQIDAELIDTELRKFTEEKPLTNPEAPNEELWAFPISSWAYYHKLRQMEWIVQLGFELDIYQNDELAGMYWYLSCLAGARFEHLERMQTFITHRFKRSAKINAIQENAFTRSFTFLDTALLEASAIQSFAISLANLYTFLTHYKLFRTRPQQQPYGTAELRYYLRMQPFVQLSLPELPSYDDFIKATTIHAAPDPDSSSPDNEERASSCIEAADEAIRVARKEWDAISKLGAETARCGNCEEWWRTSVKDVVRACIACSIAIATVKKGLDKTKAKNLASALQADKAEEGKGYHDFWVVPRVRLR